MIITIIISMTITTIRITTNFPKLQFQLGACPSGCISSCKKEKKKRGGKSKNDKKRKEKKRKEKKRKEKKRKEKKRKEKKRKEKKKRKELDCHHYWGKIQIQKGLNKKKEN